MPGGIPPQHLMINQILGMLAQRYTDQRGPGTPNPFTDILGMHELRAGSEGGRLGDYALNQQGGQHLVSGPGLQSDTPCSFGPNHDCADGKFKC